MEGGRALPEWPSFMPGGYVPPGRDWTPWFPHSWSAGLVFGPQVTRRVQWLIISQKEQSFSPHRAAALSWLRLLGLLTMWRQSPGHCLPSRTRPPRDLLSITTPWKVAWLSRPSPEASHGLKPPPGKSSLPSPPLLPDRSYALAGLPSPPWCLGSPVLPQLCSQSTPPVSL